MDRIDGMTKVVQDFSYYSNEIMLIQKIPSIASIFSWRRI